MHNGLQYTLLGDITYEADVRQIYSSSHAESVTAHAEAVCVDTGNQMCIVWLVPYGWDGLDEWIQNGDFSKHISRISDKFSNN